MYFNYTLTKNVIKNPRIILELYFPYDLNHILTY